MHHLHQPSLYLLTGLSRYAHWSTCYSCCILQSLASLRLGPRCIPCTGPPLAPFRCVHSTFRRLTPFTTLFIHALLLAVTLYLPLPANPISQQAAVGLTLQNKLLATVFSFCIPYFSLYSISMAELQPCDSNSVMPFINGSVYIQRCSHSPLLYFIHLILSTPLLVLALQLLFWPHCQLFCKFRCQLRPNFRP